MQVRSRGNGRKLPKVTKNASIELDNKELARNSAGRPRRIVKLRLPSYSKFVIRLQAVLPDLMHDHSGSNIIKSTSTKFRNLLNALSVTLH